MEKIKTKQMSAQKKQIRQGQHIHMKNGLLHLTFIASNDSENQANIGTPSAVDGATKDFIHSNYLEHCFLVINSNF